ncbi:MAG TPA: imidazole glycerol phosphate synthase subunit HisH [Acidobacteriota bacterium]|nr:imidazole glycerol phosphate synthase subunit HisH [Acidobacteriota bacterium]
MKVALLDFGVGNLHSLGKALQVGGAEVTVYTDASAALRESALVLPGVGAFGAAAERLGESAREIRERLIGGHPCLGICLGMQLLYESSEEAPGAGIALLPGRVRHLRARRTPQMGWNSIERDAVPGEGDAVSSEGLPAPSAEDPLLAGVESPVVYYANRYVVPEPAGGRVIARTEYEGDRFPAVVRVANTWGTQFHPEKSAEAGLCMLRNFLDAVRELR